MEMDMSQNHQPPKLGWCEILKSAVFGGPIGTTFFSHAKIMFETNSGYFGDVSNFERLAMIPDESTNQKTMKISHNLRQKHYEKAAGQTGNMKDGRGDIRSSENQQN